MASLETDCKLAPFLVAQVSLIGDAGLLPRAGRESTFWPRLRRKPWKRREGKMPACLSPHTTATTCRP